MKIKTKHSRLSSKWSRKKRPFYALLLIFILMGNTLLAQDPYYYNWVARTDWVGDTETLDLGNGNTAWHTTYNTSIEVTKGISIGLKNDFWYQTDGNNNPVGGLGTREVTMFGITKTVFDTNANLEAYSGIINNIQAAVEIGLAVSGLAGLLEDGLTYMYSQGYGW